MRNASAPASRARRCAARMLKTSTTVLASSAGSCLDRPAQREPVELRDEDLGDDDVGRSARAHLERGEPVVGELDGEPGLVEEVGLELADVRIALDDEDDRAMPGACGLATHQMRRETGAKRSCVKRSPIGGQRRAPV